MKGAKSNSSSNPFSQAFRAGQADAISDALRAQQPLLSSSSDDGAPSDESQPEEAGESKPPTEEDTWFLVLGITVSLGFSALEVPRSPSQWEVQPPCRETSRGAV